MLCLRIATKVIVMTFILDWTSARCLVRIVSMEGVSQDIGIFFQSCLSKLAPMKLRYSMDTNIPERSR